MSFDWREYLRVARLFADPAFPAGINDEAAKRTAVSRAYYAAFGYARVRAQFEGFVGLESAEDHALLRQHFDRTGRRDLARILNKLRQWRNQVDYETSVNHLPMMTKEAISEAQRLI